MDKLKMAHEYALKQMESLSENSTMKSLVSVAWQYADAMQAEADEREKIELSNKSIETILNADLSQPMCLEDVSEWQPDWSQAPEWANWWSITKHGQGHWFLSEPKVIEESWVRGTRECRQAPSFNYQGNWKDSLRKRPSNI